MAFCSNCGAQYADDVKFCPSCGQQTGSGQTAPQQQQYPQQPQQQPYQQQPGVEDQNEKTMAIIGYFLFFIPLLALPNSKFARYHANQGLILLLTYVALGIVNAILNSFIWRIVGWGVWGIFSMIFTLAYIALAVIGIMGIVNVIHNKMKPMPLIGGLLTLIK
jgi:uncharacterized membrane protein